MELYHPPTDRRYSVVGWHVKPRRRRIRRVPSGAYYARNEVKRKLIRQPWRLLFIVVGGRMSHSFDVGDYMANNFGS